jgi:hypothetical protein
MQNVATQAMISMLDSVILGSLCVESVLGGHNNLYLGFGNAILPLRTIVGIPGKKARYIRHAEPPYRLASYYSLWWIAEKSQTIGSCEDVEEMAEIAALSLVGRQASNWNFLQPGWGIQIYFEGDITLQIRANLDFAESSVWSLEDRYGFFWVARNNGQMYTKRAGEPDPANS